MKINEKNWEQNVPTITLYEVMTQDDAGKYVIESETATPYMWWRDGNLYLSAEEDDGLASYYGLGRGDYQEIHPELEKWAEDMGCFWEWENAGCLVLAAL